MWAYLKGARVYNDALIQGDKDQAAVVDILIKNTFVEDPAMWTEMRPTGIEPNGTILADSAMAQQDYFASLGEVKETVTADEVIDELLRMGSQRSRPVPGSISRTRR